MASSDEKSAEVSVVQNLISRSPGLTLCTMGIGSAIFMLYLNRLLNDTVSYLVLGISLLVTLAGIIFVFLEIRRTSAAADEQPMAPVSSDLEHAVVQLGKNYDILRTQAIQGFMLAGTMLALGVCVILAGAAGSLFGLTAEGSNLTTVAGIVVEVVSGLGLYLFRQTFLQLNRTSDRLHDTWRILAAFRKVEALADSDAKMDIYKALVTRLIQPSAIVTDVPVPNPKPKKRRSQTSIQALDDTE